MSAFNSPNTALIKLDLPAPLRPTIAMLAGLLPTTNDCSPKISSRICDFFPLGNFVDSTCCKINVNKSSTCFIILRVSSMPCLLFLYLLVYLCNACVLVIPNVLYQMEMLETGFFPPLFLQILVRVISIVYDQDFLPEVESDKLLVLFLRLPFLSL